MKRENTAVITPSYYRDGWELTLFDGIGANLGTTLWSSIHEATSRATTIHDCGRVWVRHHVTRRHKPGCGGWHRIAE